VNKLINTYSASREKFAIWPLLDTALTLSKFTDFNKNIAACLSPSV
jgi:hypothetical protein